MEGDSVKADKNHIRVNGRLLQVNKRWSHLKQKQREWIYEVVRLEHQKFIEENNQHPRKNAKRKIIEVVEDKVNERGIWLPRYELVKATGKYIDKFNRKVETVNSDCRSEADG